MTPEKYDFPTIKSGDSFFPDIDGSGGGLRFRYYNKETGVGYDDLDITIQFKTYNGYLRQTFSTTANPDYFLIERLGNGFYNIPTHIVELKPDLYYHDWEAVWPEATNPTISTKTGKWLIEQDISNSTR